MGMCGYVWVCMGMYGYLDVMFLVPYFSIVVDVGSYIIGGLTTTMGMYWFVWVCKCMCGYVGVCIGIYGYVWLCMGIYGYVWVCMGIYGYVLYEMLL